MNLLILDKAKEIIANTFGGKVARGKHSSCSGDGCLHEIESVLRHIPWTDCPSRTRSWDRRNLNDVHVSDALRAEYAPKLIAAYWGSLDWTKERELAVATRLIVLSTKRTLAELPCLPGNLAAQCRAATDSRDAISAADAVATRSKDASREVFQKEVKASTLFSVHDYNARAARKLGYAVQALHTLEEYYTADVASLIGDLAQDAANSHSYAASLGFPNEHSDGVSESCQLAREAVFRAACECWLEAAKAGDAGDDTTQDIT